jgi:hypothetical protein
MQASNFTPLSVSFPGEGKRNGKRSRPNMYLWSAHIQSPSLSREGLGVRLARNGVQNEKPISVKPIS